jgi:two-component system response regulator NreC
MTEERAITVMLADDHAVVRTGLRLLVDAEQGLVVIAEAGDIPAVLRKVAAHRPRILVLDLNMPGGPSLPVIERVFGASPGTAVVVLTMQDDPAFAREALKAGALGYVLKEAADAELIEAIRRAADGRMYMNPELGARLAREPVHPPAVPDNLSPREREVLTLIALGHTNSEIASQLYLSVRTIESHRAHIQRKTGRATRAELASYAREEGLLD